MFNILHEPWATIKPWTSELRCYFIYRISLAIDLRLEWDYRKSPRSKRWSPHGTVFLNRLTKIIQFFSLQQFTSESLNCFLLILNSVLSFLFQKAAYSLIVTRSCCFPTSSHCHPSLLFFCIAKLYLEICHFTRIYLSIHIEEVLATKVLKVAKQHLFQYWH